VKLHPPSPSLLLSPKAGNKVPEIIIGPTILFCKAHEFIIESRRWVVTRWLFEKMGLKMPFKGI